MFQLIESFRGRVVDIQHENVMMEISGTEGKVEAFIELMRPYGILELARTGRIALVRGTADEEGRGMTAPPEPIVLPTRRLAPALVDLLRDLKPGDAITVVQTVRVGARKWEATAGGAFRGLAYLQTGITTDRVKDDDLVVPVVRFTKANGELTSISLDENTKVTRG